MSGRKVNKDSVPDTMEYKSDDFLATDAMKCAPLGGMNEHSVDPSIVMNMPIGPDGHRMVPIWGKPQKIPLYKSQGVQPVRKDDVKRFDLQFTSGSISMDHGDGLVYRDSRQVCLCMTTKTNKKRLDENADEAVLRAKTGKDYKERMKEFDEEVQRRFGTKHYTREKVIVDDENIGGTEVTYDSEVEARPDRAKVKVSMAGKKVKEATVRGAEDSA